MLQKSNLALKENSPYSATITREQFLFYEMRTTAKSEKWHLLALEDWVPWKTKC